MVSSKRSGGIQLFTIIEKQFFFKAGVPVVLSIAGLAWFSRFVSKSWANGPDIPTEIKRSTHGSRVDSSPTIYGCVMAEEEKDIPRELRQSKRQLLEHHLMRKHCVPLMDLRNMIMKMNRNLDSSHLHIGDETSRLDVSEVRRVLESIELVKAEHTALSRKVRKFSKRANRLMLTIKEKNSKLREANDQVAATARGINEREDEIRGLRAIIVSLLENNERKKQPNYSETSRVEKYSDLAIEQFDQWRSIDSSEQRLSRGTNGMTISGKVTTRAGSKNEAENSSSSLDKQINLPLTRALVGNTLYPNKKKKIWRRLKKWLKV